MAMKGTATDFPHSAYPVLDFLRNRRSILVSSVSGYLTANRYYLWMEQTLQQLQFLQGENTPLNRLRDLSYLQEKEAK